MFAKLVILKSANLAISLADNYIQAKYSRKIFKFIERATQTDYYGVSSVESKEAQSFGPFIGLRCFESRPLIEALCCLQVAAFVTLFATLLCKNLAKFNLPNAN